VSIFFDLGCLFFYQLFFRAASTLIGRYKIEIILESFRGMFKSCNHSLVIRIFSNVRPPMQFATVLSWEKDSREMLDCKT